MNAVFGELVTCERSAEVEPTKAACARRLGSHSGCAITSASGRAVISSISFLSENVSWTTHVPGQTTNLRFSFFSSQAARFLSGAKTTGSGICLRITSAAEEVQITSERA